MEAKTIFSLACLILTVSSLVDAAINTKGDNGSIDPQRDNRGSKAFSNNNNNNHDYQHNNNNNNYANYNRNNDHQNQNNNYNNNVNQNNYNNGNNYQNYGQNNQNYGQNNYNNNYNNNNNGYRDPIGNVWNEPTINNPIRNDRLPVSSNPVYAESKNVPATPLTPIPTDYKPDPHPIPQVPGGANAMWVPGMTETFVIAKTDDPTETYELSSEPMWDVKADGTVRM